MPQLTLVTKFTNLLKAPVNFITKFTKTVTKFNIMLLALHEKKSRFKRTLTLRLWRCMERIEVWKFSDRPTPPPVALNDDVPLPERNPGYVLVSFE